MTEAIRKPVIYLAGPMLGCTDDAMSAWRNKVKKALGHKYDFIDPVLIEVKDEDEKDNHKEVVEGDLAVIRKSDIVLAYCWKASPGTSMELVYSHVVYEKHVVVVNIIKSGWIKYHSAIQSKTLEEAIDYLLRRQ